MSTLRPLLLLPLRRIPFNSLKILPRPLSAPKGNTSLCSFATRVPTPKYATTKKFARLLDEKNFSGALACYNEEIKNIFEPDTFLYREVIEAVVGQGEVHFAFELLQEMCARGVAPNIFVFHTLLKGLAQANNYPAAFELLVLMKNAGHSLTVKDYNVLLEQCGSNGNVDKLELVLKKMKANAVDPDQRSFCQLIFAHLVAGSSVLEAQRAIARLRQAGLTPEFRILSLAFLHAMNKANLLEASNFLKQALATEISETSKADAVLYIEQLLEANAQKRNSGKVVQIFEYFCQHHLMPPPMSLRHALIASNKYTIGRIITYTTERCRKKSIHQIGHDPSKVTLEGGEVFTNDARKRTRAQIAVEREKIKALSMNETLFPRLCDYVLDYINLGNPSKGLDQFFTICGILEIKSTELSLEAMKGLSRIGNALDMAIGAETARSDFEEWRTSFQRKGR